MLVFRGRRVKVEFFNHVLPNGRVLEGERVVFPPVVSVLPIVEGSVVFIKQYRPALGVYTLEIPSGVVENGEAPEEAAVRELEEEAGLRADTLELLFEGVVSPGYSTEYSYIYLAENPERVPPRREEYEVIDAMEIPLSRALDMLKSGQIRDMRAALALSLYYLMR